MRKLCLDVLLLNAGELLQSGLLGQLLYDFGLYFENSADQIARIQLLISFLVQLFLILFNAYLCQYIVILLKNKTFPVGSEGSASHYQSAYLAGREIALEL